MSITEKLKGLEGDLDAEIKKVDATISSLRIERRKLVGLKSALNPKPIRKPVKK